MDTTQTQTQTSNRAETLAEKIAASVEAQAVRLRDRLSGRSAHIYLKTIRIVTFSGTEFRLCWDQEKWRTVEEAADYLEALTAVTELARFANGKRAYYVFRYPAVADADRAQRLIIEAIRRSGFCGKWFGAGAITGI